MSRGIGALQRRIIECLSREPEDVWVNSGEVIRAVHSSPWAVTRALHGLQERGLVELRRRRQLTARLTASAEQRAIEQRKLETVMEKLASLGRG